MANAVRQSTIPKREAPSKLRRVYILRLIGRCAVAAVCALMLFRAPEAFDVLEGWAFFEGFSPLHLLWGIWMTDMAYQLFPIKGYVPLGSQKLFKNRFEPVRERINHDALKGYLRGVNAAACLIFAIWAALVAALGLLHSAGVMDESALFMVSVAFYVCDLICVLIWCPFRLMLKNRCCTTCRIFNWDHMMMFTPMIYVNGFYSMSILAVALIVFIAWELAVLLYPERFWEFSNDALKCANCTDKLCTQYCRKLRT